MTTRPGPGRRTARTSATATRAADGPPYVEVIPLRYGLSAHLVLRTVPLPGKSKTRRPAAR